MTLFDLKDCVMDSQPTFTSFAGTKQIRSGELRAMLRETKAYLDGGGNDPVLIFEDQTGQQVDFDFRGTLDDVVKRTEVPRPAAGPGRPKLGVVAREVTLLPRHWEWLEQQPSGISAALRRLVEEAMKRNPAEAEARRAREAASRFMWSMAGNFPGFEEASRALFAADRTRFEALTADWASDVRDHLARLAAPSFASGQDAEAAV